MALMYKTVQSRLATQDGQRLYHPRAVYVGNVDIDQLAREVAAYSSLTPGDVKNTIDNLVTVMTTHLQSSETVTLDGLGTFRLAFSSRGNGAATAGEVNAGQSALRVRFQPSSTRNTDRTVATRSLVTGVKCVQQPQSTSADSSDDSGTGGSTGGNTGGGTGSDDMG